MATAIKCPRCSNEKSWVIRRGKRKCSVCKYEWKAARLPLRLTLAEWKCLLRWFLLGQSGIRIAKEARLERKRIIRALNIVREMMSHHIPPVFEGTVETGETYLGGTFRNKRKTMRDKGSKRGRGTTNKRFLESYAVMDRYGQRWCRMLRQTPYTSFQ